MAPSVDSNSQQTPLRKKAQTVENEGAVKAPVVERAPDVEALVQETLQSTFGNAIVAAALDGADIGGLGDVLASEIAATSVGMGAMSEEGTGLLAAGNAAVAKAARSASVGRMGEAEALNALRGGGGQQLPAGIRAQMEAAFGRSFGGVRVHTDTGEAAAALGAEAVAMGSHLHFADGQYDPGSTAGKAVIAHELTHVVQAQEGRLPGVGGVSDTSMAAEREAYANESLVFGSTIDVDGPGAESVFASDVSTGVDASIGVDTGMGGSFGSSVDAGGFASGSFGMGAASLAPLAGMNTAASAAGPVEAATSAPAMLRASDAVDKEESDTEASARHEVAMGLGKGFSRAIDMSQGDRTVNVAKEGTGRRDGVFTGPSQQGHLGVDEYNNVMRDIGPDGQAKASGADEFLVDSAQHTQTANDGHVHLDDDHRLGATPETTATGPGGDPVMGGEVGGMVSDGNRAGMHGDLGASSEGGMPPGQSRAKGPMDSDVLNAAIAGTFGMDVSKVRASVDDAGNKAIGARASTQNNEVSFRSDIATDDLTDKAAMETVGHEMAHALAGGGTSQNAIDQEGDKAEATADRAGEQFAEYVTGGMKGPAPRLSAAVGGAAKRHRQTDEDEESEEGHETGTDVDVEHDEHRSVTVADDRVTGTVTTTTLDGETSGGQVELSGDGITLSVTEGIAGQGTASDGVVIGPDSLGYQSGVTDAEGNQTNTGVGYDAENGVTFNHGVERADNSGYTFGGSYNGEVAAAQYQYSGPGGAGFGLNGSYGPNGHTYGGSATVPVGPVKVGGNAEWSQQRSTELQTEGDHYTALGNVIDSLGPVGQATESEAFNWGLSAEGKVRGVGLGASVEGGSTDASSYYSAVDNFPVPGLQGDLSDPAVRAERDAYIADNPEEFEQWMGERREAVLGDATTLAEFDWRNLSAGEAVSFSETDRLGGEVSAGYAGVGVKIGGSDTDVHEVTMAMRDEGMLDIAVMAMDRGTATAGISAFGAVSVDGTAADGDISQVRFTIDTTTETGQQQASLFNEYGVLPGALDALPAEQRARFEEGLGADASGMCLLDHPDMEALAADANAAFMRANEEGDLPEADATTYRNMEAAEIRGGGGGMAVSGIDLFRSNYETIMSHDRYRAEDGDTESQFGFTHERETSALNIPLTNWSLGEDSRIDSFAMTNPSFNEDVAVFAGISGDYDGAPEVAEGETAALTVAMTDEQMAGMEAYFAETGAAEESLFNESAAEYFFNGVRRPGEGNYARPGEDHYVGHDGETYGYQGPDSEGSGIVHMMDARARAQMTGLDGAEFDDRVFDNLPESQREEILQTQEHFGDDRSLRNLANLAYGTAGDGLYNGSRDELLNQFDETMGQVRSVEDFRAMEDPALQSLYIQNAAIRLGYEERNPMLAVSLAFELEDPEVRNEVIRDVLAHLPAEGTQYLADLVGEAQAHDPELGRLLEGAVTEGGVENP